MAFNGDFSITELETPNQFTLTDESTGADANLTGRTIFLRDAKGDLVVAAIPWPIASDSILLDELTKDVALDIEVIWSSSDPLAFPSTYVKKHLKAFLGFVKDFDYRLIQLQSANPSLITTTGYSKHINELHAAMDNAETAVEVGQDIYSAQQMIEVTNHLIANEKYFF